MFPIDLFFQFFSSKPRRIKVFKIWFVKFSLSRCLIFGRRTKKQNSVLHLFYYAPSLPIISGLNVPFLVYSTLFFFQCASDAEISDSHNSKLKVHYQYWFINYFSLVHLFIHIFISLFLPYNFLLLPINNYSMSIIYVFVLR